MASETKFQAGAPAARFAASAFEKHYRELHRSLVRRLPRTQDANDVIQEVFLRVLRLPRTELVRTPQAYVYGIASHVVHELRIRTQHERVMFDSHALEHLAEQPQELSPDELAERLGVQRQLEHALTRLSPTHQAVLLLHKRDGLSREEVAQALGLSAHTVKKYIFQALAQLRAEWNK